MNANEFIQSIYKGENLDMCEEHLKAFCKAKVQELIPEHFEQIQKYKDMIAAQHEIYEAFTLNEDEYDDAEKAIIKTMKSKYRGSVKFNGMGEVRDINDEGVDFVLDFKFREDEDELDLVDDILRAANKALKGLKIKDEDGNTREIVKIVQNPDASSRGDSDDSVGFTGIFSKTKLKESLLSEKLIDRKRKFAAMAAKKAKLETNEGIIANALKKCKAPAKFTKVIEVYDTDGTVGLDFVANFALDEDGDYDMKDFEKAVSNALKGVKVRSENGDIFIIKNVTQEPDVSSVSDDDDSIGFTAHFTSTKGLKESLNEGAGESERAIIKALKSKYKGPSKFLKMRRADFDFDEDIGLEMVLDFKFPEDEGFRDYIDDIEDGVSKALKGLKVQNMDGDSFTIKSVELNADLTTRGDPEEAIGFTANF